jgi:3-hydroxybutyryl-CoA dehydrogenase
MELNKNSTIGIIGSGAMGSGIAQVAANYGHNVLIYDTNPKALENSEKNLSDSLNKLVAKNKISEEKASNIVNNITYINNLNDLAEASLVIEAIIENIEIKQAVFHQLDGIVSSNCVLASNTSSLSIASIAAACEDSSRVIGIHFFNPAPLMPLVEIIPSLTTRENIIIACRKLIDQWGKTTVLAKDTPGFIVNRIARPYYGEAIRIYEEGIADFSTIDNAMRELGGFRMGPFELMDFIGNDVNFKVTETVWQQFFYEPRYKPSFTQKRLFEAKLFGRKSGKGYYDYSEGTLIPEPEKNPEKADHIFKRIISMLINEAVDALFWQIASKEDIESAMTKGVNYPKGLLKWGEEIGLENVLSNMENLYTEYSEDRYRPSPLLKRMVKTGKTSF